jgi:ubiquitin carboxyl-terminal hydrolase 25/28
MDYDNEESMDVNEAYSQLQIPLPGKSKEDNTVLYYYAQKMSDAKSDAEKAKYQRALRVIAYVRNSDFLKLKSENPNAIHEAPSGEPVGIQNVGNTCYLASLMQLFYTIPLRDNVLAFQDNFPDRVKDGSDGVRCKYHLTPSCFILTLNSCW